MTTEKARFTPTISLGNVIQIATMLVLMGMGYADLRAEDRILSEKIEALKSQRTEDLQRFDGRFKDVLDILRRIENRMDSKADKP